MPPPKKGTKQRKLTGRKTQPPKDLDLETAVRMARACRVAHSHPGAVDEYASPPAADWGEYTQVLGAEGLALVSGPGGYVEHAASGSEAVVCTHGGAGGAGALPEAVVAFRATVPMREWVKTSNCVMTPNAPPELGCFCGCYALLSMCFPGSGVESVHTGLRAGALALLPRLRSLLEEAGAYTDGALSRVVLAGHGVGGSLAAVAAAALTAADGGGRLRCPLDLFTFGAPRPGDAPFCAGIDRRVRTSFRFVNGKDVVPRLPHAVEGYTHAGRLVHLERGEARLRAYNVDEPLYEALQVPGGGWAEVSAHTVDEYVTAAQRALKTHRGEAGDSHVNPLRGA